MISSSTFTRTEPEGKRPAAPIGSLSPLSFDTGRELQPQKPRHELVGRERLQRTEALHQRLLRRRPLVPRPGRFEECQAQQPLAAQGGEGW